MRDFEISGLRPTVRWVVPIVALALLLPACATQSASSTSAVLSNDSSGADANQQRLQQLIEQRESDQFSTKFGLGPGDELEIAVPDVDELKSRTVERVSPQGDIELPIAGIVHVGGLTEAEARDAIIKALSRYVKDPQVDVFVSNYASRQVAVMGMVNKPGQYPLTRRNETILDLVGEAGGLSDGAGSSLIFLPGAANVSAQALSTLQSTQKPPEMAKPTGPLTAAQAETRQQIGPEKPQPVSTNASAGQLMSGLMSSGVTPIYLNIATGRQRELEVPVRPGDVIMVPARGQVLVQGWVANPGAYQITPGMTALAAITAAGGQLYSSNAVVLRDSPGGHKISLPVDLSKVESGQSRDVQVQSGDVVIVQRSALGAVPYSLYFLLTRFGTGLALPVPML